MSSTSTRRRPQGHSRGKAAKSIAVSVRLENRDKTLTDQEIDAVAAKVVAEAQKKAGATLRGWSRLCRARRNCARRAGRGQDGPS